VVKAPAHVNGPSTIPFRALLFVFTVLIAALLAGIWYQRAGLARDRQRYPAPGTLVRLDGRRLHVNCNGEGNPVVVFESGIAASSLSWALVTPEVATLARTCAYDRAGLGWSDPPASPSTFEQIVDDLSAVVDFTSGGSRCVLVGHSFGSFVVRAYAMRHPRQVAGVVLVDPAVEWLTTTPERSRLLRGGRQLARVGAWLAHLGVVRACLALVSGGAPRGPRQFVRIFGPTAARTLERLVGEVRKLPPDLHPFVQAHWCQPKCFAAIDAHLRTLERDVAQIAAVTVPRDIPVVVISSADQPAHQLEAHRRLAAESARGRHIVATRGAHWVQFDQPELVVDAIRELFSSADRPDSRT
jgi:pimeloyl-ACP methyl ester carboxylesterase